MIETSYCNDNAGWACNELGRHYVEGRLVRAGSRSRVRLFLARVRGAVPGRVCEPARSRRPARCQSAGVRSSTARARRRSQPARHAGTGVVRARLPAWLELRVRAAFRVAMMTRTASALASSRCVLRAGIAGTDAGARAPSRCHRRLRRSRRRPVHHGRRSRSRSRGVRQRAVVAGGRRRQRLRADVLHRPPRGDGGRIRRLRRAAHLAGR